MSRELGNDCVMVGYAGSDEVDLETRLFYKHVSDNNAVLLPAKVLARKAGGRQGDFILSLEEAYGPYKMGAEVSASPRLMYVSLKDDPARFKAISDKRHKTNYL